MQPGVSMAHILAASITCSFGIQQISETFSGVKSRTRSRSSSKPNVQLSHELLVPELLFVDDVHHAHGQSAVGARPGLDPQRGPRSEALARGSMMIRFLQ